MPCGRPQMSRILARGSLETPPRMLETMYTTGVRLWEEKVLVTKGLYARAHTSCSDVTK